MSFLRRGLGDGRRPRRDDRFTSTRLPIQQGGISVPKRTPAPREKSQAHENSLFSGCGGGMARDRGGRGGRVSRAGRWLRRAWGLGRRGERGGWPGDQFVDQLFERFVRPYVGNRGDDTSPTQTPHKPHDSSFQQKAGWRSQKSVSAQDLGRPAGLGPVGGSSAGPANVSSFLRCLVTPQAFADPRLACALLTTRHDQPRPATRVCPLARGRPCSESRRSRQAEPWMAKRRRVRASGGHEGRSERPATGRGRPRSSV